MACPEALLMQCHRLQELTAADVNVPNSTAAKNGGQDDSKAGLLHGIDAPNVHFSADGTFVAIATATQVEIVRVDGGNVEYRLPVAKSGAPILFQEGNIPRNMVKDVQG